MANLKELSPHTSELLRQVVVLGLHHCVCSQTLSVMALIKI